MKRILQFYQKSYSKRPILTLCCTNSLLGILGDGLAQTINYYDTKKSIQKKEHQHYLYGHLPSPSTFQPEDFEYHQQQQSSSLSSSSLSFQWDYLRTLRFASYNFSVAPIAGTWYMFLDCRFPMPTSSSSSSLINKIAFKRMLCDQLLFAPAGLLLFFSVMAIAETQSIQGIKEKLNDAFLTSLRSNYTIWPLVQWINFKYIPLPYRLPFVNSLGILWNGYLSWLNNATKQHEEIKHLKNNQVKA
ncbi:unnamed protein product [Cunninghamella blakesleeana]